MELASRQLSELFAIVEDAEKKKLRIVALLIGAYLLNALQKGLYEDVVSICSCNVSYEVEDAYGGGFIRFSHQSSSFFLPISFVSFTIFTDVVDKISSNKDVDMHVEISEKAFLQTFGINFAKISDVAELFRRLLVVLPSSFFEDSDVFTSLDREECAEIFFLTILKRL